MQKWRRNLSTAKQIFVHVRYFSWLCKFSLLWIVHKTPTVNKYFERLPLSTASMLRCPPSKPVGKVIRFHERGVMGWCATPLPVWGSGTKPQGIFEIWCQNLYIFPAIKSLLLLADNWVIMGCWGAVTTKFLICANFGWSLRQVLVGRFKSPVCGLSRAYNAVADISRRAVQSACCRPCRSCDVLCSSPTACTRSASFNSFIAHVNISINE